MGAGFAVILSRLFPLYGLVVAGYILGKTIRARAADIAALVIYFFTPCVVFAAFLQAKLTPEFLALPFLFYCLCSAVCGGCLLIFAKLFPAARLRLFAFAAGNSNSGYFGIPVGIAILGPQALPAIVLCSFGFIFYENTIGFYVTARGRHGARESLQKVARLPSVYAFLAAILLNLSGFRLSGQLEEIFANIRGGYSVLGMMIIGLAIAELQSFSVDWSFSGLLCSVKYLAWPPLAAGLLLLDRSFIGLFGSETAHVIFYMSTLPLAANTVAIAALLKVEPERAAVAVLLSTVLALLFVPLWNSPG